MASRIVCLLNGGLLHHGLLHGDIVYLDLLGIWLAANH